MVKQTNMWCERACILYPDLGVVWMLLLRPMDHCKESINRMADSA